MKPAMCPARHRERERGAALLLVTIVITGMIGMTAIVVDLGAMRSGARIDQSIADLAALAGGANLPQPSAACRAAVSYINANARLSSTISSSTFCSGMDTTSCSSGGSGQATPSTTVGNVTVSIHYPVPDAEIADSHIVGGKRLYDATPCQRIRVVISIRESSRFGGIFGQSANVTTRSATAIPWVIGPGRTPALWMLDPTGCVALEVSGGAQVTVGDLAANPVVPGVVTLDSDGSSCQTNQKTLSASGSNTWLKAVPTTGDTPGAIQLYALPQDATTCTGSACDPADVSSGRVAPQPVPVSARATRSRVDDVYNCKASYPNYHGISLYPRCDPSTTPSYVDNLKTAIGTSGSPGMSFQRWSSSYDCNPKISISVAGNWWVDCPTPNGLQISNNVNVEFQSGNVVFDGGVKMTGGSLRFNTNNPTVNLPTSCKPPIVVTPCKDSASRNAAFVYVRNGDVNLSGGQLTVNRTTMYVATGYTAANTNTPPTWTAPSEGPFTYLALWADMPSTSNNTSKFSIAGGGGATLEGVFFTPEAAPFSLSGNSTWLQPQHAQFISYRLKISGGSGLTMSPDPTKSVTTLTLGSRLIR